MINSNKRIGFIIRSLAPFVILSVLFLLLPALMMLISSFNSSSGGLTLANYKIAFTNAFYLKAITNSIKISFVSSLSGLLIALFCAYSISKLERKEQNLIITVLNMTSNFSGVPLSFGYILLLGNAGLFIILFKHLGISILKDFDLYSWAGLTITYIYFQIPLGIMLLYPAFLGIKKEWTESAMLLGANSLQFWFRVGVPILMPSIIGTFSMLLANAIGAYATAYALVGSNYNLLTIRISTLMVGDVIPKPEFASALGVILGATTISMMLINERMSSYIRRGFK